MRLESNLLTLLERATAVAKLMGITEISMEDNAIGKMFRGMSDLGGTPVVINHVFDDDLPFGSLAIRDTGSFISKLMLAQERDENYRLFINIDDKRNCVSDIELKGSKFKLNFVAGSADAVKAPKRLKDPARFAFEMSEEDIKTLEKGVRAMNGEFVTFVSDGSEVSFEIKTGKTDVFSYAFAEEVMSLDGSDDTSFAFSYPVKTIVKLIKNSDDKMFKVGAKGIFNGVMESTSVSVFPRI